MDALTDRVTAGLFEDPPLTTEDQIDADQGWLLKFRHMDKYAWDDPSFVKRNKGQYAFKPIPLTQGFFWICPAWAYKKMTVHQDGKPKHWHAKIDRDRHTGKIIKVYARRSGRKEYGEPKDVYASREILELLGSKRDIDHVNGWTLDNRSTRKGGINLEPVSVRQNIANAMPSRRINLELKRGVEKRGLNAEGKQRYGGIYAVRTSKKKSKVFRSKRTWLCQEHAHRWYCNQMKRRFGRENWAFDKATLNYPIFPPTKAQARKARAQVQVDALIATF